MSAWVMCCVCAGLVDVAITYLQYMDNIGMRFDAVTFSLMMHPSTAPNAHFAGAYEDKTKGFLMQQRLGSKMQSASTTATVGVHAMLVFYSLTLNFGKFWETVRQARENGVSLCERSAVYCLEVFRKGKGIRCGPQTSKALIFALLEENRVSEAVEVLHVMRRNEALPQYRQYASAQFSDEALMQFESKCAECFATLPPEKRNVVLTSVKNLLNDKYAAASLVDSAKREAMSAGGDGTGGVEAKASFLESFVWPLPRDEGSETKQQELQEVSDPSSSGALLPVATPTDLSRSPTPRMEKAAQRRRKERRNDPKTVDDSVQLLPSPTKDDVTACSNAIDSGEFSRLHVMQHCATVREAAMEKLARMRQDMHNAWIHPNV